MTTPLRKKQHPLSKKLLSLSRLVPFLLVFFFMANWPLGLAGQEAAGGGGEGGLRRSESPLGHSRKSQLGQLLVQGSLHLPGKPVGGPGVRRWPSLEGSPVHRGPRTQGVQGGRLVPVQVLSDPYLMKADVGQVA